MDPTFLLVLAIGAPLVCGLASLLIPRSALGPRVAVAIAGPAIALSLLTTYVVQFGTAHAPQFVPWMPDLQPNLQFNADQLGLFFAFLVAGIGLLITVYARAYFGPDADSLYRFYPSLHLFMTAMIGVALADNFMLLLLFWEMTSISSFLLIGWDRDDAKAVKLAMQAFVVTAAGGLVMMAGLILMGIHTGSWSFSELLADRAVLMPDSLTTVAFAMIFVGAAAKSAQIPFHFWLPGAMAAPTPVSAYLHSATMVKAGVYLTGRMWPILATVLPVWPSLIVPVGAATMVYGAFIALQKTDLKQIFAYTTVSQLGLLMAMYGLGALTYHGQPNLIWDVTQILNHALYKAPLFILAGAIGHIASRQLPELRGLFHRGRTERTMTIVMLLAAYALAAGPLTLSFAAKEFFFYQIWHGYEATRSPWFFALIAAGVATGAFNVAIFLRLATTLLARPDTTAAPHHDAHHGDHGHETGWWPAFLWIPGAVIVAFQYVGGIAPPVFEGLFGWLEPHRIYEEHLPGLWSILAHPGVPLLMSLAAIGLGCGLGLAPVLRRVYRDPFDGAYPGFYDLCTKGGGWLFGRVQTGNAGSYLAMVFLAIVGLFAWSVKGNFGALLASWPAGAVFESGHPDELRAGVLLTLLVCTAAVLLPVVKSRASRVLMLGTVGFTVTAVYYLYKAPDLALTQISIEIVSLILFLLVLSLLPKEVPQPMPWVSIRLMIASAVGVVMFWLTLTSSVGARPALPYTTAEGTPLPHLGAYFLRNAHHARDTAHVPAARAYGGVVDRGAGHLGSFGTHHEADTHAAAPGAERGSGPPVTLHKGGGGRNVVNVILVDFRGFDTMGEITVLGLAALGVWTLLRRSRQAAGDGDRGDAAIDEAGAARFDRIDIPEPTGGPDAEDATLRRLMQRSPQG